jgi:hypothetical protein
MIRSFTASIRVTIRAISYLKIEWARFASRNTNEKNSITIKALAQVTKDLDQVIKALRPAIKALLPAIKDLLQVIKVLAPVTMDITTSMDIMENITAMDIIDIYEQFNLEMFNKLIINPFKNVVLSSNNQKL